MSEESYNTNIKAASPPKSVKFFETIPNRWPGSQYEVEMIYDEFSCICPITSLPDYAQVIIQYSPNELLIEAESVSLYLGNYRNEIIFHEHAINKICQDIVDTITPFWMRIHAKFNARSGIRINPTVCWGTVPSRD